MAMKQGIWNLQEVMKYTNLFKKEIGNERRDFTFN